MQIDILPQQNCTKLKFATSKIQWLIKFLRYKTEKGDTITCRLIALSLFHNEFFRYVKNNTPILSEILNLHQNLTVAPD